MTAGTWLLTRLEDGLPRDTQRLDLDGVQDVLAEFLTHAETQPDGTGFILRKKAPEQGRVPPIPRRRGHLTLHK